MIPNREPVMTRLLIYEPSFRRIEAEIRKFEPGLDVILMDGAGALTSNGKSLEAADAAPDAAWLSEALYMSPQTRTFVGILLAAPALKWVQSAAAGFDNPLFARLVRSGARLTTSHGQAVGMADYVLWGVLDAFQRGPERRAAQDGGRWEEFEVREVAGTTWLIIGFGSIGKAVAARARAFGARIIGVRRNLSADPAADQIVGLDAIGEQLAGADVVVICTPLNAATYHMADETFFEGLKDGAVLVNVGRGRLIDESALLPALERGRPVHAILDVFETEPLPAESPLWRHPRVTVTAHCSGVTGGQTGRNEDLFVDNLSRFLEEKVLLNEADPADVLAGVDLTAAPVRRETRAASPEGG